MNALKRAIQTAQKRLTKSAKAVIETHNEYVVWRHQLVGERNPLSNNAMGMDPKGLRWKTRDYLVSVQPQGLDQDKRSVFFGKIEPVVGDLIIRLAGQPMTAEEARTRPRVSYYRVVDFDVRRDPSNEIIYVKIMAVPDRSGQWQEYRYGEDH